MTNKNVSVIEVIWKDFYAESYVRSITNGIIKKLKFSYGTFPRDLAALVAYYNHPNYPPHIRKDNIALYAIPLSPEIFDILDAKKLVTLLEEETKRCLDDAVAEWEWYYDRYSFWS